MNDIDFYETWLGCDFVHMAVYNYRWRKWTAERIKELEEEVVNDFGMVGLTASVQLVSGKPGMPAQDGVKFEV